MLTCGRYLSSTVGIRDGSFDIFSRCRSDSFGEKLVNGLGRGHGLRGVQGDEKGLASLFFVQSLMARFLALHVGEVSPSTPLALFCPASHTNFNDSDFYSLLLPFPAFDRSHRRLPARTPRTPCFSSKRFISERWFSGPGFKVITRIFGYSNSRYAFSDLPGAVPAVALTTIIVRTIPIVTRPRTLHVDASTAKIFPDLDPDWIVRDEVFKRGYQSYYPVTQDNRGLTDPHTPQLTEGALSKAVDIAYKLI